VNVCVCVFFLTFPERVLFISLTLPFSFSFADLSKTNDKMSERLELEESPFGNPQLCLSDIFEQ